MQTKRSAAKIALTVVALFFTLLALFPLVWVIIAGFKEKTEVLSTPFRFLPRQWLAANYLDILKDAAFQEAMLTTFGGALLFAVLSLAVNSAAAYVFARLEFRFKPLMWLYVITTMFIPGMAILLTSFIVVNELAMLDTFAVLVLPGIASAGVDVLHPAVLSEYPACAGGSRAHRRSGETAHFLERFSCRCRFRYSSSSASARISAIGTPSSGRP